jgi:DNA-directed RNA polymerase subunit RPC12/RpoP
MDEATMEVLCKNCGQTFTAFLQEMADKNAVVVCPRCGKSGANCGPNEVTPPAARN